MHRRELSGSGKGWLSSVRNWRKRGGGVPQEALATTSASGEVVSIHIDNCQYYPAALLSIDRCIRTAKSH